MTQKHLLALLGFAFVAAWISFTLGYALLCLIGAAVFYAVGGVLQGEIDLGELQDRVRGNDTPGAAPSSPPGFGRPPRVR